jgi:uncharacterized tellurite resistance protein B-like protein
MLSTVRHFFERHIHVSSQAEKGDLNHRLQVATAALLYEVMRMGNEFKDAERHMVTAAIEARFALTAEETAALLRRAEARAKDATDYYEFTALINQHFTAEQKEQVVEYLWQVACADREIDRFERTLVNKIADLLYVPRAAQVAARERALRVVLAGGGASGS